MPPSTNSDAFLARDVAGRMTLPRRMDEDPTILQELYQATILEHNKNPHHYGVLEGYTEVAEGYNPLCGDKLTFYLKRSNGKLKAASFECAACAICKASASILLEMAMKANFLEYKSLHAKGLACLNGEADSAALGNDSFAALSAIRAFPSRLKCARLAWETLQPN